MANVTSGNPIIVDSVGLIFDFPVCVRKIILFPNAAGDGTTIYHYDPSDPLATQDAKTTTVASGVFTSTGAFESTEVEAYGVIAIDSRSKTGAGAESANVGLKRMVASRDSDNQITTAPTDLTDEASATYYWRTYSPVKDIVMESSGTEKCTETYDPPETGGHRMPNLIVGALDTSAVLHIYI